MARQSPNRHEADEPEAEQPESAASADVDEPGSANGADEVDRGLWDRTLITPVEIALPAGTGYTLRAYRLSNTLTPTETDDSQDEDPFDARTRLAREAEEDDDESVVILDEEFAALLADEDDGKNTDGKTTDGKATAGRSTAGDAAADADSDATGDDGQPPDHDDDDDEPVEEVPVFLSHRGRLLLFKSPESLVAFVRSGAPHDLAQLDTFSEVAERVQPADIAAQEDDTYELDLVVENLRGGHDTWDLDLLIRAGELARDLAYALRLRPVVTALSPGSPLDDLDEALRAAAGGGVGGFMGRRRLRRIGAQQASLGWRSIIGKISAAVDWRD